MHLSSSSGLDEDASVRVPVFDGVHGKKLIIGSCVGESDCRAFFDLGFDGVVGTLDVLGLRFRLLLGDGCGGGIGLRSTSSCSKVS